MNIFENARAIRERERQDKFAAPYRFGILPGVRSEVKDAKVYEKLLQEEQEFTKRMDESLASAIRPQTKKPRRNK